MEKRIFDEKAKRALSSLLPFAQDAYVEFTPEEFLDFPQEYQPVFSMRRYDAKSSKLWRSETFGYDDIRTILKQALTGWRNLRMATNIDEKQEYSQNGIDIFSEKLLASLHRKGMEITFGISREEKEGLESSPQSESESLSKTADSAALPPA